MNISERDSAGEYFTPLKLIELIGQGLNDESYAIWKADMLSKGQGPGRDQCGSTLSHGNVSPDNFDYALSNPPFGAKSKPFGPPVSC